MGTIQPVKSINLAVRFLLELGALAGLAYWGWQTGTTNVSRILLAVVAPILAAVLWGWLIAPKAPRRREDPVRVGIEVIIFGSATAALISTGATVAGVIFSITATVSLVLMFVFDQRGM